jgi:hypothetical protein
MPVKETKLLMEEIDNYCINIKYYGLLLGIGTLPGSFQEKTWLICVSKG